MTSRPDPPDSPPQLQRGKRVAASGGAQSRAPPPPGTEVGPDAAIAAGLHWHGDLAQTSPLRLGALAAGAQATGRLVLHGEAASYTLFFRRGTAEHASSSSAADDLGRFLVAQGAVEPGALASAEQRRIETGEELVSVLAASGAMNPAESFRLLQEHAIGVLARALAVEVGHGFWEPNVPLPASAFPLGSRFGPLCDAVRRIPPGTVTRRLGPRAGRVATRVGGRVAATELRLSSVESRAVALLDGVRSVSEIAAAHPAEGDVVRRVALLLAEVELLVFGEERPAPAPPVHAEPSDSAARSAEDRPVEARTAAPGPQGPPKSGAPASSPAVTATARPVPPDLPAIAERIRDADYFTVLAVARDAAPAAIKVAYFALARQVHPDAAPPGEPPEDGKLRAEIFARVSQAWSVLSDDARRARYLAELSQGAAVDVARYLEAEELFTKGTVFVRTRQYPAALDALTRAIALNGEEPEFRVWRAWVEFLLATDKRAAQTMSAAVMEGALKESARCVPAYLFLGQMAKLVGDVRSAERHWRLGLALAPDNVELERELKYLRK